VSTGVGARVTRRELLVLTAALVFGLGTGVRYGRWPSLWRPA
jgi:hypothetical protein